MANILADLIKNAKFDVDRSPSLRGVGSQSRHNKSHPYNSFGDRRKSDLYNLIEQMRLLFLRKLLYCNNQLLRMLATLAYHEYLAIAAKYNIHISMDKYQVKQLIWQTFAHGVA